MQDKASPELNATAAVYVGVDVCKDWLDVCVQPLGLEVRVSNTRLGVRRLIKTLAGYKVARLAMEATGKYHRAAHRQLHAAGIGVVIVNPLRSRLFAEALGALAKTDAIDARILALLAERLEPPLSAPPSEDAEALAELVQARRAAINDRTALSNQRGACASAFLKRELAGRRKTLEAHIARLDAEIARRIAADPLLARRNQILQSIPGLGPATAAALISGLGEIGQCSAKQASMLAGLAPIACDSGHRSGKRHIRGGRAHVRTALYMAAISASRFNPALAAFYKRLRNAGKPPKLAFTAVMRKLVVLANTLVQQDRLWTTNPPSASETP